MNKKKLCLVVMDGFGVPTDEKRSGITRRNTTFLQELAKKYPNTTIKASEEAVGLPGGQMGTSEVGHLTMGVGRVVYQPIVEINRAISDGSFFSNETLVNAFNYAKKENKAIHLLGLPTDGGIHSHINHLFAIMEMAGRMGLKQVYNHYFTDGRDTPVKSAERYLKLIERKAKECGCGEVVSVMGRFYALDRDKNYDRMEKAYRAMVNGQGLVATSAKEAILNAYSRGETDEFITPTIIQQNNCEIVKIESGDVVISYNFRTDREKQLAQLFDNNFNLDYLDKKLKVKFISMTEYDESFTHAEVVFKPNKNKDILSEVLSLKGYNQIKIAETEKFAHVTFFFNNGKTEVYKNEERVLINSVKMQSYKDKPEMSAKEVADATIDAILSNKYDFIVTNFANPDMVGHSGDKDATRKAIKVVDSEVKRVVEAIVKQNGMMILTADHGNADIMEYEDGSPCSSHTTAPVPIWLIGEEANKYDLKEGGTLADIAPTILELLGEEKPTSMTGTSLLKERNK